MFQIHIPAKTKYILSRLTECGFEHMLLADAFGMR